eukprot:gene14175-14315_t
MGNKRKPNINHNKLQHQQDVPLPAAGADSDDEQLGVEDEDLEFVQKYGRQIGFLRNLDAKQLDK